MYPEQLGEKANGKESQNGMVVGNIKAISFPWQD